MEMTQYNLDKMVTSAATGFEESQNLNEEIAKIAEVNELTPNQIQALVEETNHVVFDRIYKTAQDKRFVFDMAEADKVMGILHPSDDRPKVASLTATGFTNLRIDTLREKRASVPFEQEEPDWIKDAQARFVQTKHNLRVAAGELKKHAEHYRQIANTSKLATMTAVSKLKHEVTQNIHKGTSLQLMYKLSVAQAPSLKEPISSIFADLKEDLDKTASMVEKELLNFDPEELDGKDEIGTRIVNGNNPLFIHLTGLMEGCYNRFRADPLSRDLEDTASALVSSIHRLNTPEDVDSYLANEVQRLAYGVKLGAKQAVEACNALNAENDGTDKTAQGVLAAGGRELLRPFTELVQV